MEKYQIGSSVAFSLEFAPVMNVVVQESKSIVSVALTDDATLNLSTDAQNVVGDEVIVKASSDGTARTLTFGTGFTAPNLVGVINSTKVQTFVFDGSGFIAKSASVQID